MTRLHTEEEKEDEEEEEKHHVATYDQRVYNKTHFIFASFGSNLKTNSIET